MPASTATIALWNLANSAGIVRLCSPLLPITRHQIFRASSEGHGEICRAGVPAELACALSLAAPMQLD